jgi:hypothetical protein
MGVDIIEYFKELARETGLPTRFSSTRTCARASWKRSTRYSIGSRNFDGKGNRMHPSEKLIKQHAPKLAQEIRELVTEHPGAKAVGLILEAGAAEAEPFRRAMEAQSGQTIGGAGFFGLVPRKMAVDILRTTMPAALEWLEPDEPHESRLPVVVVMKAGIRLGVVNY